MAVVLIPAFEPDERLVTLVRALLMAAPDRPIVVIDDGSGAPFAPVFRDVAASGALVVHHSRNRGKGAALKTGFRVVRDRYPGAHVVTADGDGQHTPVDVERVARRLHEANDGRDEQTIVLGARSFDGAVPLRSRIGNTATRAVFRLVAGRELSDTQTGLRGIPAGALEWMLGVPGDRFDYEFRALMQSHSAGVRLAELPIATVYTDGNSSSHFRPIADSLRIYAPVLRFAASALLAFFIDLIALLAITALTGSLVLAVVGARVLSATVNFTINRRLVFRRGRDVALRTAALRYMSLAALILAANFGTITALTDAGVPLVAAKLLTEATLFLVSFTVQRAVVFAPTATGARMATPEASTSTPAVSGFGVRNSGDPGPFRPQYSVSLPSAPESPELRTRAGSHSQSNGRADTNIHRRE